MKKSSHNRATILYNLLWVIDRINTASSSDVVCRYAGVARDGVKTLIEDLELEQDVEIIRERMIDPVG